MGYEAPKDYVEVKDRIVEFRTKYPNGSMQTIDVQVFNVPASADKKGNVTPPQSYVMAKVAAYRVPDDPCPGIGVAWEPIPGRTPYTKDSELMNAETSAWGRAMIAALAVDAQKGIASANEVRNRQYNNNSSPQGNSQQVNGNAPEARRENSQRGQRANQDTPWSTAPAQEFNVGSLGKVDLDKLTDAIAQETNIENLRDWYRDIATAKNANVIDDATAGEAGEIIKARVAALS